MDDDTRMIMMVIRDYDDDDDDAKSLLSCEMIYYGECRGEGRRA